MPAKVAKTIITSVYFKTLRTTAAGRFNVLVASPEKGVEITRDGATISIHEGEQVTTYPLDQIERIEAKVVYEAAPPPKGDKR